MTAVRTDADRAVVEPLRDAASWRLLGRLFECPDEAWRQDVERLRLEAEPGDLQRAAAAAVAVATEGLYHSIFGPGGPAPAREVSYHDTLELGSLMSELVNWYDAFGYRPATTEPPDHIAVEIGFASYLRLKEAFALARGRADEAAAARCAFSAFRAGHLAAMAGPLKAALAASGIDYLATAARVLHRRSGDPPRRPTLTVVPTGFPWADDDESTCGEPRRAPGGQRGTGADG